MDTAYRLAEPLNEIAKSITKLADAASVAANAYAKSVGGPTYVINVNTSTDGSTVASTVKDAVRNMILQHENRPQDRR